MVLDYKNRSQSFFAGAFFSIREIPTGLIQDYLKL